MFTGNERLDSRIEAIPECGCWIWIGPVNSEGYGTIKVCGHTHYVHRLVYSMHHHKPIPRGLVLLHKCDTRRCCNPHHTRPASHRANMRDMVEKGRAASRSNGRHACCKLAYRIHLGLNFEENESCSSG